MRNDQLVTVRRSDYTPPPYLIDRVELEFDLDPISTRVTSILHVRRNAAVPAAPLDLDGEDLLLESIKLDGTALAAPGWQATESGIRINSRNEAFELKLVNRIAPSANTELMGIFVSNGNFFSQCEAQGFRRITYFLDRPDVMARYTVTLRANKAAFPVLLSNGNLVTEGVLANGLHYARWEDPYAKPSYLFALVAGTFVAQQETIRRMNGKDALLQVWVAPGSLDRAQYAMSSLKDSIRWDEQRYGLSLDLDRFMIVASNDFNMGAMENKGLNIFNAKYVLASPAIATDTDYANIESIVGHEYFHNWTGNRVTCRDWFQLSLKEGLTVFRDQEFSADMLREHGGVQDPIAAASAATVKRIDDVRMLRAAQFPEDAGPMAHPIRPDEYQEISNFYTATVYEKGAEVVRMLQTMVGVDGFRSGMNLYFERHDGQAVTCDDFVSAIGDANQRDLTQFRRWYAQSGTPRVVVGTTYDPDRQTLEVSLAQNTPPTPGQAEKEPFHIPFAVGLVNANGVDLPLQLAGEAAATAGKNGRVTRVLELTQASQTFQFINVPEAPTISLLRDFSAPVIVEYRYSDEELAFLAIHDNDAFNRWEAVQRLCVQQLGALTDMVETETPLTMDNVVTDVLRDLLSDSTLVPAFKHQALLLPAEGFVAEQRAMVDPEAIRQARQFMRREIGQRLSAQWQAAYVDNQTPGPYSPDPAAAGKRALKNLALTYLIDSGDAAALDLARRQLGEADNMTDKQAALEAIVNSSASFKVDVLLQVARDWHTEPLMMNKWFQLQATAMAQHGEPAVVNRVRQLMKHQGFSMSNPNNVYALIRAFCCSNNAEFHRADGSGYAFWVEQVLALDRLNPTVSARVARALDRWRKFTPDRQQKMRDALQRVAKTEQLSRDVREIVSKALEN